MCAVRRFHSNQTPRQIGKELSYCIASQRFTRDDFPMTVDAVNFEDVLRQILAIMLSADRVPVNSSRSKRTKQARQSSLFDRAPAEDLTAWPLLYVAKQHM